MSPCLPQDKLPTADTSDRHIFNLTTAELHLHWMITIVRNLTRGQLVSGCDKSRANHSCLYLTSLASSPTLADFR